MSPDAPTARALARRELARGVYAEHRPGLLLRAWDAALGWLGDRLDGLAASSSSPVRVVVLVLLVALVAAAGVLLARALGRSQRRRRAALGVIAAASTAADLRAAADAAAAADDWDTAVRLRFSAVVRAAQERDEVPTWRGLTAAEAAQRAGAARPDLAGPWRAAAAAFEAVAYGGAPGGPDDDAALRRLDQSAASPAARPVAVA